VEQVVGVAHVRGQLQLVRLVKFVFGAEILLHVDYFLRVFIDILVRNVLSMIVQHCLIV